MYPHVEVALVQACQHDPLDINSDRPRCLAEINGVPLLVRLIENLEAIGLQKVVLTVGWEKEQVSRAVQSLGSSGLEIEIVHNPHWEQGSAESIRMAKSAVGEMPFLLVSPRTLYSPQLVSELMAWPCDSRMGCMTVETDLEKIFDPDPLLKVELDGLSAQKVGHGLARFEAISTGLFRLNGTFFDALENGGSKKPVTFVDGLAVLASKGLLEVQPTDGLIWHEITNPLSLRHARWLLSAQSQEFNPNLCVCNALAVRDPQRVLSCVEGILSEKNGLHYTLMNPGPVLTTARVKSALVHHDICHRDEEFPKVMRRLRRKLKRVFGGGPEHEVLLITGSGTSGMEAAISSCVPRDQKLLVVANGAFGERFIEIAELHEIDLVKLHYSWGEVVRPEDVEALLQAHPDIFAVAMCHHETSVGIINPIHEIGNLCQKYDRLFIVDTVASLGGEEIDVRKDQIDVCVSSANKCLHAISGVAVICVSARAWERIEPIPPRVYYLNLKRYKKYAVEKEETPFTPAVSSFFALDAAIDELLAEGVEGRVKTYRKRNQRIRRQMKAMGFSFLDEGKGKKSQTITCAKIPDYITFKEMYDEMKRRGYLIYNSKEHLEDKYFQVANMGDLSDEMIESFLSSLRMVLASAASRVRHRTRQAEGLVDRAEA